MARMRNVDRLEMYKAIESMDKLQRIMHEWRTANFPEADGVQQLLGVVEEVGELSHAVLKGIQGIRGMEDEVVRRRAELDAVGDILIYLAGFCSYRGYSMVDALWKTWEEVVGKRNWLTNSYDGIINERAMGEDDHPGLDEEAA